MALSTENFSENSSVSDIVEQAELTSVALTKLLDRIEPIFSPEEVQLVKRAYEVAYAAHDGQTRSSGEPYITHPISVAHIVLDMQLDHQSVMAALLHDVLEDTKTSRDELVELFGDEVTSIVDGLSKLNYLEFKSKEEAQAESFRKMLLAMVSDIRVILIKLADRLHNMRTIGVLSQSRQKRIGRETLDVYAPIAGRLGMFKIKNELEDIGFECCYPVRTRILAIPVEVQIRTKEMDEFAESGIAAHWAYKEGNGESVKEKEQTAQFWLSALIDMQSNTADTLEFVESVKDDLLPSDIYVFTQKGKIIELPKNATPVDFAFAVHSQIGYTCVSAKVDKKKISLSSMLESGQTVEISTDEKATPSPMWLNFVVTPKARTAISHCTLF